MNFDETTYRLLRGEVYAQAYRRLGDHHASEDIVQDSFLKLSKYRAGALANVGAMVSTIARNLIVDHVRSNRRQTHSPLSDEPEMATEAPSQEHVLLHRERAEQVSAIIAGMPEQRRKVFIMRRLHGKSAKEVASELNISSAAVDTHVARAVLALHKEMSILEEHA